MTIDHYQLGPEASLLDRSTLRIMRWWRRSGRDFVTGYVLAQLLLAAVLSTVLAFVPSAGFWSGAGAVAALLAPGAAWVIHRRTRDWPRVDVNHRARGWGAAFGVLLIFVTGWFVLLPLTYLGVAISMLAAQGPLGLVPAVGTFAAGWVAATIRKRQLDDPVYP